MANYVCPHNCRDCYALRVCAVQAITENQSGIALIAEKCIGCGACVTACATFGSGTIRYKMVKVEKFPPLPSAPGSPWPDHVEK